MEPRAARASDLEQAAAWLGWERPPASWREDLELGAGFAIDDAGHPAGLVLLRCWGRVVVAPVLLVDPARRGRGFGRALAAAARDEALRRDARTFGLEADPFDHDSLSALLRLGFKAGPPLVHLEWQLPEGRPDEAEPSQPPDAQLAALAGSLDGGFDPAAWIEGRRRAGARLLGARSEAGAWSVAALVEPSDASEDLPALSLVLVGESQPFEALDRLAQALAAGGHARVRLDCPARLADALAALVSRGARPCGLRLRLTFGGFPERTDLHRLLIAPWR